MKIHTVNPLTEYLIQVFEKKSDRETKKKNGITVDPFVSEFASWYEKIRNAMEYRDDEVILRATIERIVKRLLILNQEPKQIASVLIRELVWARYFPDGTIDEKTIDQIAHTIFLYLQLGSHLSENRLLSERDLNEWMYQLMSSAIEHMLNPNTEKEAITNFMFHILRKNVMIEDESEETRDVQVLIAVRRAYAKEDLPLLRYQLFIQYYGDLHESTIQNVADSFIEGYAVINKQLSYPLRNKIYLYIKKYTPPFLILEDILRTRKGQITDLITDEEKLTDTVLETCERKYRGISSKVQRAIIRSVIFILFSKTVFALAIESTYENLAYGKVLWGTMAANILTPPILMIIVALFIRTPGQKNSILILNFIKVLLLDPDQQIGETVTFKITKQKTKPLIITIFTLLWIATFILSFGFILYVLTSLHFNLVSQGVFVFFVAIVSFLSYRINKTAKVYTVEEKQSFMGSVVDFFFIPVVQAGRYFTEGISQINIILFLFDFIIETPFKSLFAFAEQWFFFLRTKREELE